MELRRYGAILWRYKWLIVAVVAAAVAGVWASGGLDAARSRYRATATLLVTTPPGQLPPYPVSALRTKSVARDVVRAADATEDPDTLLDSLRITSDGPLVRLEVDDENPEVAAALANGFADAYLARVAEASAPDPKALKGLREAHAALRQQIAELSRADLGPAGQEELHWLRIQDEVVARRFAEMQLRAIPGDGSGGVVRVLEPASPPTEPIQTAVGDRVRSLGGVGGAALLAAVTLAFLLDYVDDRMRTEAEVEQAVGLPVVATLPSRRRVRRATRQFGKRGRRRERAGNRGQSLIPDPRLAEAFQSLRVHIDLAARAQPLGSLLIASPYGAEKTPVSAYLGTVLAQAGRRVVLVSADLHRPAIETLLGVATTPGLGEAATGRLGFRDLAQPTWVPGLEVVPAGTSDAHPADVLASASVSGTIDAAREAADVVLLEAPPVLASAESAILVPHSQAIVLVLEAGVTTREQALAAKAALEKVRDGAPFLGVVLTNVREARSARRYNGNGHRWGARNGSRLGFATRGRGRTKASRTNHGGGS